MPNDEKPASEPKPKSEALRAEAEARAKADAMQEARERVAEEQKKAVRVLKPR